MHPAINNSSHALDLRRRAEHLTELSSQVENALLTALPAHLGTADDDRSLLLRRLVERHLQQLHRAADDLRTTAHRFHARADELDRSTVSAA